MNKELIMQLGENDPYRHLYFEKDLENGGEGFVRVLGRGGRWVFEWDRERSNRCLEKYGFSFYLALHICDGDFRNMHFPWGIMYYGLLFSRPDAGMVYIEGKHLRRKSLERPVFRIMFTKEEIIPRFFIGYPGGIGVLGLSKSELDAVYDAREKQRGLNYARGLWHGKKRYGRYLKKYSDPSLATDEDKEAFIKKYFSEDWW